MDNTGINALWAHFGQQLKRNRNLVVHRFESCHQNRPHRKALLDPKIKQNVLPIFDAGEGIAIRQKQVLLHV